MINSKSLIFKIKPKKTFFFQKSVVFLGHVLSKDGISPNPEKVSKVRDWPVPKTAKEVHSFSGISVLLSLVYTAICKVGESPA